jgi:hypothetical protein
MGHATPALNIPFLTTRELFLLKLGASAEERRAYIAADPPARRRLLDEDYAKRPLPDLTAAAAWTAPIAIDQLEWFASPLDLCRAFAALQRQGGRPAAEPVLRILSVNTGLPTNSPLTKPFSYVGFKGGSEPGVLAFGWLLRRLDGAWMVVSVGFADPAKEIDDLVAFYYAAAALTLAGL